ncbi:Six-hairpin glycosidase-like protein [Pilobolus umbonatus]|nr:Six-hairpin glycosidase-like protein [Pilobolus umbonatus]
MIMFRHLITFLLLSLLNAAPFDINNSAPHKKNTSPEYARLLNHSLLFYEAQRSGKLTDSNRISWRHDSALKDGYDVQLDLSGGYYDAGDYLKFTFPLCYTVFMLSWGGIDYFEGYKKADQITYLRDQIKWATDWLIKVHPEPSKLFVQVGEVEVDNNSFGPDTELLYPRPSYQINETHFGTDVASMAAAAFATASTFFTVLGSSTGSTEDQDYAKSLLVHAKQLHNASISITPYTRYQYSVHTAATIYQSTDYKDDLILSGIAMYRATNDSIYLRQSLNIYKETYAFNNHSEPLGWDNKHGAVFTLLAGLMMKHEDQEEFKQRRIDAETYLDGIVSGKTANKTEGGLLWWDFYSDSSSNSNAVSASHLLLYYSKNVLEPLAEISIEKEPILKKIQSYQDMAFSQLDYIFGKNPINQNYIVGARENSPKYPHSAPASGFPSLKYAIEHPKDLSRANVIYGALVGGPSKNDSFADVRLDWAQTEVALDYNAAYQNVLAYQIMYDATDPFYVEPVLGNTTDNTPSILKNKEHETPQPWVITSIVLLSVIAIILLIYAAYSYAQSIRSVGDDQATIKEENYINEVMFHPLDSGITSSVTINHSKDKAIK